MEAPRIGLGSGHIVLEPTHTRQSTRPRSFEDALRSGVGTLLAGAEVATGVLGGPVLSAAVRGMRREVEAGGRGPVALPAPGLTPGALVPGAIAGLGGGQPAGAVAGPGGDGSLAAIRDMQREARDYNLDLLLLQEATQRENREFQTVSNTLRALHDTAKACIGNLHA